jgi:lipoprotein YgeR
LGLGNRTSRTSEPGETYRVKKGDTLWQVSRETGVAVNELIKANRLRDPDHLEVGQRLRIPRSPATRAKTAPGPARPKKSITKPAARAEKPARSAPKTKLVWPIQERFKIASRFGGHKDGLNRGIDLAAPEGTPVVAACDGLVTNAFSEHDRIGKILGYGNLIFLSHDNGLITLYGYNRDISVNVGDRVKQGEKIAEVGNTGRARGKAGCRLHFEIRDKHEVKKVYDPEKLLPPPR